MNEPLNDGSGRPLTFRHELKYVIDYRDKEKFRARLSGLIRQDDYALPKGYYQVRSLYFDDVWNSAYEDKLAGAGHRNKYRIRLYPGGTDGIRLENKIKRGDLIAKQTAELTREEVEKILRGNYAFLLESGQHLCRAFYHACVTELYRPRVLVDYEREPYVFAAGDVRITFDTNVRAAVWGYDLFDERPPMLPALEPGQLIMEIKYTEFLPNFIRSALPSRSCQPTAVSKYILACNRTPYAARS